MFLKCMLRQFGRGQRPQQAYHFTKSLLVRWRLGERGGLWSEAVQATNPKQHRQPGKQPNIEGLQMPPPSLIPVEDVAKAIRSFHVGVGPGPGGLRADLLKALMGHEEDEGILPLYRDFVQLLADGLAPTYLRPWLGGGQLIGIGKVDQQGAPIPLDQDARPIVMGLTWRKVVFKRTLAMDKPSIRTRLMPSQLAHAPASARFGAYCYGRPTNLVYQGEVETCSREQQGCLLMGPLFCLTRHRMTEEARRLSSRPAPEFEPAFADDAFSGGHIDDVYAAFRQELQLAQKYGLHVDPAKCTLYLLAGDQFRGDVSRFQALGVNVVSGTDITMLKVPIGDNPEFLHSFHKQTISDFDALCSTLESLPHVHVAFYLFSQGGTFSKLQWWCRTTPRAHIAPLLQRFHDRQKLACEHMEPAIQHLAACLPVLAPSFCDPQSQIDHRGVLGRIHQQVYLGLMNQHDLSGRARLTA
ncbi:unnamed protein product [Cladocopium goreaui]|uniref:132 kDa protein n=1 Tax=Cladocopium goreaui TaxID=2562237 RepID=A0A9P1CVT0_9DINO|nr:unnamed protein product [Cladocopium goreaui]